MQDLLKFLGTSDAQGVPRMLCNCPVCLSPSTMNHRKRPSVLFHTGEEHILIDVSPDFQKQFLQYENQQIPDTVLITHCHNDHIAGFGDYGDLCYWNRHKSLIVSPAENIDFLRSRYPYLNEKRGIEYLCTETFKKGKWNITFHKVNHGFNGSSYGIRFQSTDVIWAYIPDAFDMTSNQLAPFEGCELLILGTSFYEERSERSRRSVYDVTEALELKEKLGVSYLVLTHLSHDIDISRHRLMVPFDVQFAHDGLQIPVNFG